MSKSILLKNGRLLDPANGIDRIGNLFIRQGRCYDAADASDGDIREIDMTGKWLMPGFIDLHVHLREPGEEYKETIESGTAAAVAGGFTAVTCMPNTIPVIDSEQGIDLILSKARQAKMARVYPVGAISKGSQGEEIAEFGAMQRAGAVAFSDDGHPVVDSHLMRQALDYASNFHSLIISHSEEISLSKNGAINEGPLATRLGLAGIPRAAEEIMVYRDLALAEYTGQRLHLAHISTRESVDLIRRAKARGCRVSAETAPHYFSLTEEAIGLYDTAAKMNPPLRTADDVAAVKEGLRDGTLDAIATDHAPHSAQEKEVEFSLAANGIIGLETAVSLTLRLVQEGAITEKRLVELLAVNPAKIIGVEGGSLQTGGLADITVID
ncbi:MAG: dihydroorotase, partial [Deltaproteobacteria bacterium]|nr:dihydroorotase [Deltaproteobacteria bacterium]